MAHIHVGNKVKFDNGLFYFKYMYFLCFKCKIYIYLCQIVYMLSSCFLFYWGIFLFCLQYDGQSHDYSNALDYLNIIFTGVFASEFILKLAAFRFKVSIFTHVCSVFENWRGVSTRAARALVSHIVKHLFLSLVVQRISFYLPFSSSCLLTPGWA